MRKYHAITVHYGDEGPTRTLVEQLLSSPLSHIVVVDHAKNPFRATWSPDRVTLVRPKENAGYAAGVNFGLGVLLGKRVARDNVVLAMNNDIAIETDTIAKIQTWWEKHPDPVIAGARMGLVNLLTGRATIQDKLSAKSSAFWRTRPNAQKGFGRAIYHLPYLHGTLLVASLDTFLTLQGLPNHFFMYWEDVLFSLRAQQMGIPLHTIPGISLTHDDSLTALADNHLYYLVRSGAVFLSQSSPRPWRWWWRAANLGRRLYHFLRPATPRTRIIRQALRDAALGHTGKRRT